MNLSSFGNSPARRGVDWTRRLASAIAVATCVLLVTLTAAADDEEPPAPAEAPQRRLLAPRDAESRAARRKAHGITGSLQTRIANGLDWLARHQQKGGGWDADGFPSHCEEGSTCDGIGKGQHGEEIPCPFDGPISALATLAFLANGHAPGQDDDPHAEVVERAAEHLLTVNDRWGLPLATLALSELQSMQPDADRLRRIESNVEALTGIRQDDGAWGYAAPWRPGSDVPYTALVVQALVAAGDVGVAVPDDLGERIDEYLDSLERDDGRLAYLVDGRRYGYTPTTSNAHCAAALRLLVETGVDGAAHRSHLSVLSKRRPKWKISFKTVDVPGRGEVPVQIGHLSMYQWWYGTIASYQQGRSTWKAWWSKLAPALVKGQASEGCARGSWEPLGTYERQTGGRVFATALGVLMLSEPLRHERLADSR